MGAGTITLKDDPRVLPVGKLLRKQKLLKYHSCLTFCWGYEYHWTSTTRAEMF